MRFPVLGLLTAGLVAGQIAAAPLAAAQCVRPADHASFDITALKTSLLVVALTCGADERYNAFIRKYQPELTAQDRALGAYFTRVHGRTGRKQQDDYVTQLANSQSQFGNKQGNKFCQQNLPAFDEVMALHGSGELAEFAAGKSVAQPINVVACGGAATPASTRSTSSRSRRRS